MISIAPLCGRVRDTSVWNGTTCSQQCQQPQLTQRSRWWERKVLQLLFLLYLKQSWRACCHVHQAPAQEKRGRKGTKARPQSRLPSDGSTTSLRKEEEGTDTTIFSIVVFLIIIASWKLSFPKWPSSSNVIDRDQFRELCSRLRECITEVCSKRGKVLPAKAMTSQQVQRRKRVQPLRHVFIVVCDLHFQQCWQNHLSFQTVLGKAVEIAKMLKKELDDAVARERLLDRQRMILLHSH